MQLEPECWRSVPGYGSTDTLRPDLLLVVAHEDLEFHWFVEVDLATENRGAIQRKCTLYDRYYRSGIEQQAHGIFPKVAWLTTSPRRTEYLERTITELRLDIPLFEVGLLDDPLSLLLPVGGRS